MEKILETAGFRKTGFRLVTPFTTPVIGPVLEFLTFKVFYRKWCNWKLIRDDMILDNKFLSKILTEGRYPRRMTMEDLLAGNAGGTGMDAAEKLMNKKGIIREELKRQSLQGEMLWKKATDRLREIQRRYAPLPKGVKMHTDKIFTAAAIYLIVKEELGEEKAFAVIENAAITGCAGYAKKLAGLMKMPGMRSLFVKVWDPMTRKMFGAGNGFRNVFYPKKKGEYRLDIVSCPYCRYFTELGCPELTKIFCENDERIYGNLPGIKFERTGTLGKGADHCDFYLRKV